MSFIMPRMTQREMQKAPDALKAPLRFPRAEGGFISPTEPKDQEHDMSDRVTITLTDGTTREVRPDTPVEYHGEHCSGITEAGLVEDGVATIYEPTREHWTPYEPWMRDVLADDARVSWHEGGDDYRAPFVHRHQLAHEWDLRIHPDDVPERPTEDDPMTDRDRAEKAEAEVLRLRGLSLGDLRRKLEAEAERDEWKARAEKAEADVDPDEALARVLFAEWSHSERTWDEATEVERALYRDFACAARQHIGHEAQMGNARLLADMRVRAEKAEAERDEARESLDDALTGWNRDGVRYRAERDEWKARYEALRADVERVRRNRTTLTDVLMCIADILDHDDERGGQGVQS